jgi:hypothetical protein
MLQPPFCQWVKVVPGKIFNCYLYELYGIQHWAHRNEVNAYEPGDWLVHAAGLSGERRLNILRELAKLAT